MESEQHVCEVLVLQNTNSDMTEGNKRGHAGRTETWKLASINIVVYPSLFFFNLILCMMSLMDQLHSPNLRPGCIFYSSHLDQENFVAFQEGVSISDSSPYQNIIRCSSPFKLIIFKSHQNPIRKSLLLLMRQLKEMNIWLKGTWWKCSA